MCFCKEQNYKSKSAEEESLNFTGLCAAAVPLSSSLFSLSFCLISLGCGSLTIFPQGADYPHSYFALLFPPCPSAISASVGSEGRGQAWSQGLILRGEMLWRGRKWEGILPLLLPGGTLCYETMLCQLQRPSCISAAYHLLVTFLRLMLPLFHWIQISLDLCVGLPVFPDEELAIREAKDIKKDKGY